MTRASLFLYIASDLRRQEGPYMIEREIDLHDDLNLGLEDRCIRREEYVKLQARILVNEHLEQIGTTSYRVYLIVPSRMNLIEHPESC